MSTPLLRTKLYIPLPPSNLVPRPHLLVQLHAGLDKKLTLISAPAGFGKTTLLSEWIRHSETPFCWISLDESDNDIGRFLAYLIAALQTAHIEVDEQLLGILHPPQEDHSEAVLIPMINQIASAQQKFTLVLDDYHLIEEERVHRALSFMIEHQPPGMHLVISSRADPPLPLAKLRAGGQMTEMRASALRLSFKESADLLHQVQGVNLSRQDVRALANRTEGWAAGLKMASIALAGTGAAADFLQGFTGSHIYIADYLTDEVFDQQPENVQEMLLKTSILDRFCGDLCDAVIGKKNGQKILRQLRDSNLFLVPLDHEGTWFRYHRLFADLLHRRLLEQHAALVPELYLRASTWFTQNGYEKEGIDYALLGGHDQLAAELIEQEALATLMSSEVATFLRWVGELPRQCVLERPTLSILYAWALLVSGRHTDKAGAYLEKMAPMDVHTSAQLNAVKSILAVYQGQVSNAIELATHAMGNLPDEDHFFRNMAAWNLSALLFVRGEKEEGGKMLAEVVKTSRASGNLLVAVIALCRQAAVQTQQGQLHQAMDLYQQALDLARDRHGRTLPVACEAMIGLGKIYWEWNEISTAKLMIADGIALSSAWREQPAVDGYITMAHIQQAMGNRQTALQTLAQARQIAARTTSTDSDDRYVSLQQAHLWVCQDEFAKARQWAQVCKLGEVLQKDTIDSSGHTGADLILSYELVVYVRLLMREGLPREALKLLDLLLPRVEQTAGWGKWIEVQILRSLVLHVLDEMDLAVEQLVSAAAAAEAGGYVRLFIEDGTDMLNLLQEAAARGMQTSFTDQLTEILLASRALAMQTKVVEMVEPLSERELEVLRMLQTELPVQEIAERLHIATSTARSHIKSIYGKLGVHSRFEAVSKARESGLLQS